MQRERKTNVGGPDVRRIVSSPLLPNVSTTPQPERKFPPTKLGSVSNTYTPPRSNNQRAVSFYMGEASPTIKSGPPNRPPPLAVSAQNRLSNISTPILSTTKSDYTFGEPSQKERLFSTVTFTPSYSVKPLSLVVKEESNPYAPVQVSNMETLEKPDPEPINDSIPEKPEPVIESEYELESESKLKFYEPDNETNIIYADGNIKCASLSKLVEKLTSKDGHVEVNAFLLTYRSFSNPTELLEALIERYRTAKSQDVVIVKLRVFHVLKTWIDKFWYDFSSEVSIKVTAQAFLKEESVKSDSEAKVAASVQATFIKKLEQSTTRLGTRMKETYPESILPADLSVELMHASISHIEIARQISIKEYSLWSQIKPWECLNLAWTKKDRMTKAKNIITMTDNFNQMSGWVTTQICITENPRERVRIVKKFLDIADQLRKFGNFHGTLEIMSGLNRGPVHRMNNTFKTVKKDLKYEKLYDELDNLTSSKKNYAELRAAIKESNPPIIPYLGMYQTDLTFIEEGNKTLISGLINYYKCRLVSETIKSISQYQLLGYNFKRVGVIQEKLKSKKFLDEDTLYQLSSYIEPREGKEPGERPSILDSNLNVTQLQRSPNNLVELEEQSWPFIIPDSPDNLSITDSKEILVATQIKLIERLTHHEFPESRLQNFLASYRRAIHPKELLNLIIQRYNIPLPKDKSPDSIEEYNRKFKGPIRIRTQNFLKHWITDYWFDFHDPSLFAILDKFILTNEDKNFSETTLKLIEKKISAPSPQKEIRKIVPESQCILSFNSIELAKQLTLDAFNNVIAKINAVQILNEYDIPDNNVNTFKKFNFEQVVKKLKSPQGIELKDKRKGLKSYSKCFTGSELCVWLIDNFKMSKDETIYWGKHLQTVSVIECCSVKFVLFSDADELFRFTAKEVNFILEERIREIFSFNSAQGTLGSLNNIVEKHLEHIKKWALGELEHLKLQKAGKEALNAIIAVSKEILKMNNWHTLHALIAALQCSLTLKNVALWDQVSNEDREWFVQTRSIFLNRDKLKETVVTLRPPFVPCILAYREWVAKEDKESELITNGKINVKRLMNLGTIVMHIMRAQQFSPSYEHSSVIQDFLARELNYSVI